MWYHINPSGTWRSLVARLFWEQDVAGSNPVVPTIFCGCGSMVEPEPSKLVTRVRFPSSAPLKVSVFYRKPKTHTLRSNLFGTFVLQTNLAAQKAGEICFRTDFLEQNYFSLTLVQPYWFLCCLAHIEAEHRYCFYAIFRHHKHFCLRFFDLQRFFVMLVQLASHLRFFQPYWPLDFPTNCLDHTYVILRSTKCDEGSVFRWVYGYCSTFQLV